MLSFKIDFLLLFPTDWFVSGVTRALYFFWGGGGGAKRTFNGVIFQNLKSRVPEMRLKQGTSQNSKDYKVHKDMIFTRYFSSI
jgi:hypothetical protein